MRELSIIIPVLNEALNIIPLVKRLDAVLDLNKIKYELIFIDDHSTDNSKKIVRSLFKKYPLSYFLKVGPKGKAQSLLEGFHKAKYQNIGFIDADLQYPPEIFVEMLEKLIDNDIVITTRKNYKTSFIRDLASNMYTFIFGKVILGLPYDTQSGLKVFKKSILQKLRLTPTPWGFDYEFLFKAKRIHLKISEVTIYVTKREYGVSKLNALHATFELALGSINLRLKYLVLDTLKFIDYPFYLLRDGKGLTNKEDYLYLPHIFSTKKHIYPETISLVIFLSVVVTLLLLFLKFAFGISVLLSISATIAFFYFSLMIIKIYITYLSLKNPPITITQKEISEINEADLPIYTILIPLYDEAQVIPQIIQAMSAIDYPKNKLDITITLEEYDHSTINAIKQANPPAYFKTLILPNVKPKTKPKALNVAFTHTRGELLVIYDAEIIPDTDQLKKAYLAFKKYPQLSCLQTRLDHYNAGHNLLTKLFNMEFSFHYDLFLPGLQKIGAPLPLSGHSTHFKRQVLEQIRAWDPYNVAEDCDVGIRLNRMGYKTGLLDSISLEEATDTVNNWVMQRSRWMKGFMQTTIVHLRFPLDLKREFGSWKAFFGFLFVVPGSILLNFLNFFYWLLLLAWFFTHSSFIQTLFPGPILYISVISFLLGNFMFTYLNLIGAYKRKRYLYLKYGLLSTFYWLLLAYATVYAVVQLIFKPHHWSKTKHGTHLKTTNLIP